MLHMSFQITLKISLVNKIIQQIAYLLATVSVSNSKYMYSTCDCSVYCYQILHLRVGKFFKTQKEKGIKLLT